MSIFNKLKSNKVKPKISDLPASATPKALQAGKKAAWVYKIIKEPHITEKATFLAESNKYVFNIYSKANKPEVKKAIKSLYGVNVKNVHLIHMPSKKRRMGRSEGYRHGLEKGFKKAIITIAKGDKIDIMPR